MPDAEETEITIACRSVDERLRQMIQKIRQYTYTFSARTDSGNCCLIPAEEIYYIDSVDSKTFLYAEKAVYGSAETLAELENRLLDSTFVRISRNCILNIAFLESVMPLWNYRLEAQLTNGEKLVITRHYIKALKEKIRG